MSSQAWRMLHENWHQPLSEFITDGSYHHQKGEIVELCFDEITSGQTKQPKGKNNTPTMKKSIEVLNSLANVLSRVQLLKQGGAGEEEGCFKL